MLKCNELKLREDQGAGRAICTENNFCSKECPASTQAPAQRPLAAEEPILKPPSATVEQASAKKSTFESAVVKMFCDQLCSRNHRPRQGQLAQDFTVSFVAVFTFILETIEDIEKAEAARTSGGPSVKTIPGYDDTASAAPPLHLLPLPPGVLQAGPPCLHHDLGVFHGLAHC